jgi:hypothetical protein
LLRQGFKDDRTEVVAKVLPGVLHICAVRACHNRRIAVKKNRSIGQLLLEPTASGRAALGWATRPPAHFATPAPRGAGAVRPNG